MTREEFGTLAMAMKAAYSQNGTFLTKDADLRIWYTMLGDLDYKLASQAVQKHIQTSKFPPTIADIRAGAMDITTTGDISEMDAWSMVRRAIGDSAYHASERFEELPEVVKKAVGGPQNLREWSQMDSDTVGSVIQSNFLRTYRVVRNREREMAQMSPSLRKVIGMVTQKQLGVDA